MKDFAKILIGLINPETREGLLFLTGATNLGFLLLFAAGFLHPTPFFRAIIDQRQLQLPDWASMAVFVTIVYDLVVIISSADTLAYGDAQRNPFVRAFQTAYPSQHLANRLCVSIDEAKNLWFDQFNTWANDSHACHQDWQRTLKRGFSCRFIYYVQFFSSRILLVSVVWLALEFAISKLSECGVVNLESKVAIIILYGLIWIAVRQLNSISESHPTGVWRRFNEINQRNCRWIDEHLDLFARPAQEDTENAEA